MQACRHRRQRLPRVRHDYLRHIQLERTFARNSDSPAGDRIAGKVVTIALEARDAEEHVARTCGVGTIADSRNDRPGVRVSDRRNPFEQM